MERDASFFLLSERSAPTDEHLHPGAGGRNRDKNREGARSRDYISPGEFDLLILQRDIFFSFFFFLSLFMFCSKYYS